MRVARRVVAKRQTEAAAGLPVELHDDFDVHPIGGGPVAAPWLVHAQQGRRARGAEALADQIARAHDGRIQIELEEGRQAVRGSFYADAEPVDARTGALDRQ